MKKIKQLLPSFALKISILSIVCLQAAAFLPYAPLASTAFAANTTSVPSTKATWVWYTAQVFKDMDTSFNQLQTNGVNVVYLQQDVDIPNAQYAAFIKRANSLGIEVDALAGEPNWVLPEKQIKMYKFINWVKIYNLSVNPDERFKGIHLDVEPFVTHEWANDQDTVIGYWRDTVTGFVQETKAETGLATGADIPFWLDKFTVPDGHGGRYTLSKFMINQFDTTMLMAYRDNVPAITSVASNKLNEADSLGKPLLLSVETLQQNPDSFITFYGKGKTLLNSVMTQLNDTLKTRPSYQGYGVHEFSAWNQMGQ